MRREPTPAVVLLHGGGSNGRAMGATFDSVAEQLRRTADVMADGTQNPAATCDGVSIGLGFELVQAGLREVVPTQMGTDPCP